MLDQITADNVDQLGLTWSYDTGMRGGVETTPLVVDGIMYLTGPWSIVYALDARTGEEIWRHDPEVPRLHGLKACCDVVNRGAALYEGKVYVGTLDGQLVALDAATGKPGWTVATFDSNTDYKITIRAAMPDDAEAMSALVESLMAFLLPDPEDLVSATAFRDEFTPAVFQEYLSSDRYRYHVAEREEAPVGMVGIRDDEHLFHLFVAERAHRQGLARRLWTRTKRETLAAGNPGCFTVNASPYAVPVYQRFGFVATAPEQRKKGVVFVPMELDER